MEFEFELATAKSVINTKGRKMKTWNHSEIFTMTSQTKLLYVMNVKILRQSFIICSLKYYYWYTSCSVVKQFQILYIF